MYRAVCHLLVNVWLPKYYPKTLFRESSPGVHGVFINKAKTSMTFETDKISVTENWNQLVASLTSAFFTYYRLRKVRCLFEDTCQISRFFSKKGVVPG